MYLELKHPVYKDKHYKTVLLVFLTPKAWRAVPKKRERERAMSLKKLFSIESITLNFDYLWCLWWMTVS